MESRGYRMTSVFEMYSNKYCTWLPTYGTHLLGRSDGSQPVSQSDSQTASQSVSQPASQSVSQPASQSVSKPASQPISQSVCLGVEPPAGLMTRPSQVSEWVNLYRWSCRSVKFPSWYRAPLLGLLTRCLLSLNFSVLHLLYVCHHSKSCPETELGYVGNFEESVQRNKTDQWERGTGSGGTALSKPVGKNKHWRPNSEIVMTQLWSYLP
jgi:hypothetical protein